MQKITDTMHSQLSLTCALHPLPSIETGRHKTFPGPPTLICGHYGLKVAYNTLPYTHTHTHTHTLVVSFLSPVYTKRLIQIGVWIKLIQIRVNAVNPVQNPDYLIHIRMWFETRLNPVQV